MKLLSNFSSLHNAIGLMEPTTKGVFNLEYAETAREPLDLELNEGKDVELKDIDVDSGLLSYKGRQVLLYIKDHGSSAQSVINNPYTGNKFHVADCKTLKGMREQGRFERYVATNDTSGEFLIAGYAVEGKAKLRVCQHCLTTLNYKGWAVHRYGTPAKTVILDQFNMGEFFSTYSSFFPHMPKVTAEQQQTDYTQDWAKISAHYRVEKEFICEECGVNLKQDRRLLHVHHINGVKSDNRERNLKALCVDCHSKAPKHDHMYISHSDRQTITDFRHKQGILSGLGNWKQVFATADPAVEGVLHACKQERLALPEVGFYISDEFGEIAAKVELAWPSKQFAIAISQHDIDAANGSGWQAISVGEFLETYKSQCHSLRY